MSAYLHRRNYLWIEKKTGFKSGLSLIAAAITAGKFRSAIAKVMHLGNFDFKGGADAESAELAARVLLCLTARGKDERVSNLSADE